MSISSTLIVAHSNTIVPRKAVYARGWEATKWAFNKNEQLKRDIKKNDGVFSGNNILRNRSLEIQRNGLLPLFSSSERSQTVAEALEAEAHNSQYELSNEGVLQFISTVLPSQIIRIPFDHHLKNILSRVTTDNQVSEVKDSYIFSHNEDIGGVNLDDSVIGNVFMNVLQYTFKRVQKVCV